VEVISRVIDTNVYCDALRGDPWALFILEEADKLWMPMIVLGELLAGFRGGSREEINRKRLSLFLAKPHIGIIPVDQRVAEYYGLLFSTLKKNGLLIPTNDIWIASCAFAVEAPLVTQDQHFGRVSGLEIILKDR
jgi:tRNA(fMet)-specific endonuclease VapC